MIQDDVLDLVRLVALVAGLARAVRVRAIVAILCAGLLAYGFVVVAVDVLRAAAHQSLGGELGLGIVFLGTSAARLAASEATSPWLVSHPEGRHLAFAALAVVPYAESWIRSAPLRPESRQARAWDALGTPFLLLAVIESALAALAFFMSWVERVTG